MRVHDLSRTRLSVISSSYAYDRAPYLRSLLQALANQTVKDFETVIVIDGSPELLEYAHTLVRQLGLPHCELLFARHRIGGSASKNLAIQHSRGEILGFLDDDTVPFPNWAQNVVASFEKHPEMVGLHGPTYPLWEDHRDAWFPEPIYWVVSCTDWQSAPHEVRSAWTTNAAFRKGEVVAVAGFDTRLGPFSGKPGYQGFADDEDLSLRVRSRTGKSILFVPDAMAHKYVPHMSVTLRYVATRAIWIGRTRRFLKSSGVALDSEHSAIIRTVLFLPKIARNLLRDPSLAIRQATFLLLAVVFALFGFLGMKSNIKGKVF